MPLLEPGDTVLIVKSQIKDVAGEFNVSSDFAEELNKKVEELIKTACKRAEGNNRKTVMGKDL